MHLWHNGSLCKYTVKINRVKTNNIYKDNNIHSK